MLEHVVSTQHVLTLYIRLLSEQKASTFAAIDLDFVRREQPSCYYCFMDGYDLCDLLYPSDKARDEHWGIVNSLWWEVFSLFKNTKLPLQLAAVIPPGAAYEVIEFARQKLIHDSIGFEKVGAKKTYSLEEWRIELEKAWKSYLRLRPFLEGRIDARLKNLVNLYDRGLFIEFGLFLKNTDMPERIDFMKESLEWPEFSYNRGMDVFSQRRPTKEPSNRVDMFNLMTGIAAIKHWKATNALITVTSHSGHTLSAWTRSWTGSGDTPARSSLAVNMFVTSLQRFAGDVKKAHDFVAGASDAAQSIIEELEMLEIVRALKQAGPEDRRKK